MQPKDHPCNLHEPVRRGPAGRFRSGHHAHAMGTAYELLDAGDGRRLERFGELIVDRPAAEADEPPRDPAAWAGADLRYGRDGGWRSATGDVPIAWQVEDVDLRFELRPTPTGQVGLFPEQAPNRAWFATPSRRCRRAAGRAEPVCLLRGDDALGGRGRGLRDTRRRRPSRRRLGPPQRPAVGADRPTIRWIVDDVEGFVAREARRGRRYDGTVLDPPSYGHGAGGRGWRLSDRLPSLLAACADLTGPQPAFVVLTAHTPGFWPDRLADVLAAAFHRRAADVDAGVLGLRARSGRTCAGACARIIGR